MKVATVGKSTTFEFYRSDPSVAMELTILDPSNGETIATPAVTDDATSVAISTAISTSDTSVVAAGLTKGVRYLIEYPTASQGPTQEIEVIGVNTDGANKNTLKREVLYGMPLGSKIKGIRSSASWTPTAAYKGKSVWLDWTGDDGSKTRSMALCVAYEAECPWSSDDVRDRWPRVNLSAIPAWQQVAQVGWQPQIDDTWSALREAFFAEGLIMDRVVSVNMLKDVFFALLEKRMLNMGIDPTRSGESLRDSQNRAGQKAQQLLQKAFSLPLQQDDNDNNKNAGNSVRYGMRATCFAD